MLTQDKIKYFKKQLEEEKIKLEADLEIVGRKNPDVPGDWEPTPADMNIGGTSDRNDLADTFEELENRASIENSLEERHSFVVEALARIEKGKYGLCLDCGKQINEKRLEANPAAQHCIKHADLS